MNHNTRISYYFLDDPDTIIMSSSGVPHGAIVISIDGEKVSEEGIRKQISEIYNQRAEFHKGMSETYRNMSEKILPNE